MAYVIRHIPTELYIGSDEDHLTPDEAMQFDDETEAQECIQHLVSPADELEVVFHDSKRRETVDD